MFLQLYVLSSHAMQTNKVVSLVFPFCTALVYTAKQRFAGALKGQTNMASKNEDIQSRALSAELRIALVMGDKTGIK